MTDDDLARELAVEFLRVNRKYCELRDQVPEMAEQLREARLLIEAWRPVVRLALSERPQMAIGWTAEQRRAAK